MTSPTALLVALPDELLQRVLEALGRGRAGPARLARFGGCSRHARALAGDCGLVARVVAGHAAAARDVVWASSHERRRRGGDAQHAVRWSAVAGSPSTQALQEGRSFEATLRAEGELQRREAQAACTAVAMVVSVGGGLEHLALAYR
jgi:hypothetical protein